MKLKRSIPNFSRFSLFTKLLIVVFMIGFLIRIAGTNPGYPPNHPDEPIIYSTADQLISYFTLDPFFPSYKFQYPGFVIYSVALFDAFMIVINFLIHPISFIVHLGNFHDLILLTIGPSEIKALFWARYISAFYGFLSVVLVYLVGKKLFNKQVGFFAALFLAVNFRHIISSHLALVDASNSMTALLALYFSLLLLENPTLRNYFLAAASVAISFATKLYFVSLAPFVLSHFLLSVKKRKVSFMLKTLFSPTIIASSFSIVIFFLILNPFLPFHIGLALETHRLNNLRYGFGSYTLQISPLWYLYEIGYGKLLSLLFFLGIIIAIMRKSYWINSIYVLFYIIFPTWALIYYSRGGGYIRNFTSIIPFALIFSALGFFHITHYIFKKTLNLSNTTTFLVSFFLAFVVSYSSILNSIILDMSLLKEWNFECVQSKMRTTFHSQDKISKSSSVPSIDTVDPTYIPYGNFYNNKFAYSLSELQDENVNYLVINYDPIQSAFSWWLDLGWGNWGMPVSAFDNSFDGLAIKELSRYQLSGCIKSWQSIDNNFSLIKVPPKIIYTDITLIKSIQATFQIKPQSIPLVPKRQIVSDFIPVNENTIYLVDGIISSDTALPVKQRDGFLRVDFYNKKELTSKRGISASVSSRFFGSGSGIKRQVSAVASKNARYMVVSFQSEDYKVNLFLRDVKVYKVNVFPTETQIRYTNNKEIDDLIIYPNSIL